MTKFINKESAADDKVYSSIQEKLRIKLIATPREELFTCETSDKVVDVFERNSEEYDYVPVVESSGEIVGILEVREVSYNSDPLVKDCFKPLNEGDLIGGDASILKFVECADERPYRLVISGGRVAGLVTLSDLQKLPVRVVLFSLLNALEILMSEIIESAIPKNQWLSYLSEKRQSKISEKIDQSRQGEVFVNELLFTQFCDKVTILMKHFPKLKPLRKCFRSSQNLRDSIAHANDYAPSIDMARELCQTVRGIDKLRLHLKECLK